MANVKCYVLKVTREAVLRPNIYSAPGSCHKDTSIYCRYFTYQENQKPNTAAKTKKIIFIFIGIIIVIIINIINIIIVNISISNKLSQAMNLT